MTVYFEEFPFADRMQHVTLGVPINKRHCPDYRHCKHDHIDDQIRSSRSVSNTSEDVKSEPHSREPRFRKSSSEGFCFLCKTYCDDPNRHGSFYSFACRVMKIFCSNDKNTRRLGDKRTKVSRDAMISLWKLWNDPENIDGLCKFEFDSIFMIIDACHSSYLITITTLHLYLVYSSLLYCYCSTLAYSILLLFYSIVELILFYEIF
jgi:hypothetical protein